MTRFRTMFLMLMVAAMAALPLAFPPAGAAQGTACANGTAVPDPEDNPGLVSDCTILLAAQDTLEGNAVALDWSTSVAISAWHGITVSGTPQRVTAVNLDGDNSSLDLLHGTIPPGLGGLTNLTQLYLNNNELSGSIPPELGNLTNLTQLHLGVNELSGSIPEGLGSLTNLTHLHLDTNDLSGSIPGELGSLTRLTYLDLGVNELRGSIPPELGNLANLTDLLLDHNQLTGGIPPELGNLTNLVWIRLGSNSFAADACVPPALSYITFQDFEAAGLPFCEPPAQPVNFAAAPDDGAVALSWDDPGDASITGYQYRQQEGDADYGAWTDISGSDATTTSHTVSGLTNGANYTFRVRAVNIWGQGTESDAASAIPSACANGTAVPNPGENPGLVSDCNILLAARDTLSGAGALDWSKGNAVSSWQGITVSGTPERVTAVNLDDAGLTGTIPGELGDLTSLEDLDLSFNQLSGAIPAELGNLANLTLLNLYDNQLSGAIPPELGSLLNLTILYLAYNQLTGAIPPELRNLIYLDQVSLAGNSFSADTCIPSIWGWLSGDDFGDTDLPYCTVPAAPRSFTLTTTSSSPSTVLVAWFAPDNGGTPITDYDVRYKSIDETVWTDHPFTGTGTSTTIAGLTTFLIYELQVRASNAEGTGDWSPSMSVLPRSREIRACSDDALIPMASSNLGLVQDCAVLLASQYTLEGNTVGLNWSTSVAISSWQGITVSGAPARVTTVNLDGDNSSLDLLHGTLPASLGNLTNLTQLYLNNNELSGSIPPELGNLTNLTQLHLGGNELSGSIPGELGSLTNLTELGLSDNQLSGAIPAELGNLTNLTELGLSDNQLSGGIPAELGSLTDLTELDLSDNQLSGAIPAELGNLTNLTKLDLSNNQMSGAIPAELGNLTNLEWLYIQGNNLTGCIPYSLKDVQGNRGGLDFCQPALVLRQHANGGWEIVHDEPVNVGWIGVEKNDQISSAVVADGYTVELYEHGSYRGKKLTFVGQRTVTIGDLHAENMNDKISSYKLYRTE